MAMIIGEHHIHYILDEYNNSNRVWDTHNPGDAFDMVDIREFPLWFVQKFPATFVGGYPEDDAGEIICEKCLSLRR